MTSACSLQINHKSLWSQRDCIGGFCFDAEQFDKKDENESALAYWKRILYAHKRSNAQFFSLVLHIDDWAW